MLFAALHYDWSTGKGMQTFESTFLHHKVEAIQSINKWITSGHPQLITSIVRHIATLCFIEPNPYEFEHVQEHEDEELTDRYFLLILSIYTRHVSRLMETFFSGHRPQVYHTATPGKIDTLSRPLNHVERNCNLPLKLLSLRLMPFFSKPVPLGVTLGWVNGRDTIDKLRNITESLDMMYARPDVDHDEVTFAMACTNCVASQLHVDQVASHIASFCYTEDGSAQRGREITRKPLDQELHTTWCGLYIASSIYTHHVLGLREPSGKTSRDYLTHILKKALNNHLAVMGDGQSMSDQLLLWEIILGAISAKEDHQRDGQGHDTSAVVFFREAIWKWNRAARIGDWSVAKAILMRLAWPEFHASEDSMRQIWEEACCNS
ncbi:hypothetical protein FSARC_12652 [Fusarium sarcochroum]|uniref:Uncharacterized protein n=1 Tax=Fusarium sarcochroum TaxID=1208366 RepID=A0A8H4T6V3_9HYPO|nr:hypothetical protein FSARC_12652 [Fusarium sarcochroum]